jgi:hypothetical protein
VKINDRYNEGQDGADWRQIGNTELVLVAVVCPLWSRSNQPPGGNWACSVQLNHCAVLRSRMQQDGNSTWRRATVRATAAMALRAVAQPSRGSASQKSRGWLLALIAAEPAATAATDCPGCDEAGPSAMLWTACVERLIFTPNKPMCGSRQLAACCHTAQGGSLLAAVEAAAALWAPAGLQPQHSGETTCRAAHLGQRARRLRGSGERHEAQPGPQQVPAALRGIGAAAAAAGNRPIARLPDRHHRSATEIMVGFGGSRLVPGTSRQ